MLHDSDKCAILAEDGQDSSALPRWFVQWLLKERQTLIMRLGEIEDLLGLERSIVPRRKR